MELPQTFFSTFLFNIYDFDAFKGYESPSVRYSFIIFNVKQYYNGESMLNII